MKHTVTVTSDIYGPATYEPCEADEIGLGSCDHVPAGDTTTMNGLSIGLCEVHAHMARRGIDNGHHTWTYYDVSFRY